MPPRVTQLALLVAIAACLVAIALWARSAWFADEILLEGPDRSLVVSTSPGLLRVDWPSPFLHSASQTTQIQYFNTPRPLGVALLGAALNPAGVGYESFVVANTTHQSFGCPLWLIAFIFGLLPGIGVARRFFRVVYRRRTGLCLACGYDLRESPDRCPECGLSSSAKPPRRNRLRLFQTGLALIFVSVLAWASGHEWASTSYPRLDFTTLSGFQVDDDAKDPPVNIPKAVQSLNGHPIEIDGYIIPLDSSQQIKDFALVPTLFRSSRGPAPKIQETIVVHARPGFAIDYWPERVRVRGVFKIDIQHDEGYLIQIYELTADSVMPLPKE